MFLCLSFLSLGSSVQSCHINFFIKVWEINISVEGVILHRLPVCMCVFSFQNAVTHVAFINPLGQWYVSLNYFSRGYLKVFQANCQFWRALQSPTAKTEKTKKIPVSVHFLKNNLTMALQEFLSVLNGHMTQQHRNIISFKRHFLRLWVSGMLNLGSRL